MITEGEIDGPKIDDKLTTTRVDNEATKIDVNL